MKGWVHGLWLGVAVAIYAHPLTASPAWAAAALGAVLGAVAAELAERQRVRLWVRLGAALSAGLVGWLVGAGIARTALGASLGGPHGILVAAETVRWGAGAAATALALRSLALVARPFLMLETFVVVLALALPWASHRRGMIARPLELSDWFWSHNLDPVWGFVGLGVGSSVVVAALWLRWRRLGRAAAVLAAVLLLVLPLAWWAQRQGNQSETPPPESAGAGESDGRNEPREREKEESIRRPERPQQPVAVMLLHRDVTPLGGMFYLRSTAFSQFNGVRLVAATRDDVDSGVPRSFPSADAISLEGPPSTPARTTVATDVALLVPQNRPMALIEPVRLERRPNPAPARFSRQYHVVSEVVAHDPDVLLGHNAGNPSWSHDVWEHYTTTPDDSRYFELSARLASRLQTEYADDPWAIALSIREYLEQETVYSLENHYDSGGGGDPTARFLFSEEKVGYCVHLAHSAALLLRAQGIPARVSAGWAVEADRRGNGSALLVRSVDAHAWAELHLDGVGWVPLEIVPERVDAELTPFEEQDLQQLLGEMARQEGRYEPVPQRRTDLREWIQWVSRAVPWVFAVGLFVLWCARGVRAQRYRLGGPTASRWGYRSALDALASHGVRRRLGESREAFARRVAAAAPSFEALTHLFLEDRLAGRPPRARDPRVDRLTRDARAEVAGSAPWWRRGLAWIDPLSWLWSR